MSFRHSLLLAVSSGHQRQSTTVRDGPSEGRGFMVRISFGLGRRRLFLSSFDDIVYVEQGAAALVQSRLIERPSCQATNTQVSPNRCALFTALI